MVARNPDGTFPKGVTGNVNGRPKKKPPMIRMPETLRRTFFEIGEELVTVNGPSGQAEMSMMAAAMRATYRDAIKGKASAQKLIFAYASQFSEVYGQTTEFNRWLVEELTKEQDRADKAESMLPKRQTHGVLTLEPSPTQFPSLYREPLKPDGSDS